MKAIRLKQCKVMKRLIANGRHRQVLFIDKNKFTIENTQMIGYYCVKGQKTKCVQIHYPALLTIRAGIRFSGKTTQIFLDKNVIMEAKDYQKDILEPVKAWAIRHFKGNFWTFPQN